MDNPAVHLKLGAFAIPLRAAIDNRMFGRNGFYCHGDSIEHPGDASDGCIVAHGTEGFDSRLMIAVGGVVAHDTVGSYSVDAIEV